MIEFSLGKWYRRVSCLAFVIKKAGKDTNVASFPARCGIRFLIVRGRRASGSSLEPDWYDSLLPP